MRLFIAEKKSVADAIANELGGPKAVKMNGYYEIGNDIVTWAKGHILRMKTPSEYSEKYKNWNLEDLPIFPTKWELVVPSNNASQFSVIKKLILKADEIIHAGDPDREGQLLIDEILEFVGNVKPVKRFLHKSLFEKDIRKGLADLRKNDETLYIGWKNSALARNRADWTFGMNLSRAYTVAIQKCGYQEVCSIGRVRTPTMALVVRRENEIKNFRPVTYYQITVDWQSQNDVIRSIWNPPSDYPGLDSESRLIDQKKIFDTFEQIRTSARHGAVIKKITEEEKRVEQRLPYSLSDLQIHAGKTFGYSPKLVLDTMQELYEKKLTTYPRADCSFLPEDQISESKDILQNLTEALEMFKPIVQNANLSIRSRAWNDKNITAHHAIIPTTKICDFNNLTDIQKNLYAMVSKAYIAQFYDLHIYMQTKMWIDCNGELFTATGRKVIQQGWKALYQSEHIDEKGDEESSLLPPVVEGDFLSYVDGKCNEKVTTVPKRYTQSTLLAAMIHIHKYVLNPEIKAQLKAVSGIGTQATRAYIIDELIKKSFLRLEKNYLFPTNLAEMMVDFLPKEITDPDLTATWEEQLECILKNETSLTSFFEKQKVIVSSLVKNACNIKLKPPQDLITCPVCNKATLVRRFGKSGHFWSCNSYPNCTAAFADKNGKPIIIKCPKCNTGYLRKIKGKNGDFWSCNRYPDCKASFNDKKGKPDIK